MGDMVEGKADSAVLFASRRCRRHKRRLGGGQRVANAHTHTISREWQSTGRSTTVALAAIPGVAALEAGDCADRRFGWG